MNCQSKIQNPKSRRFYVPSEAFYGDCAIIKGDQAHHLVSVLRKKPGDEIVLFDGKGTECLARVVRIEHDAVMAKIERTEALQRRGRPGIALYIAFPKGRKFDAIVEAATELGADSITPLLTERTVVAFAEADIPGKLERWRRISIAAAKQCRRSTLPSLNWPVRFVDVAANPSPARGFFAIFACFDRDSLPIQSVLQEAPHGVREIRIFIGPEGGFTPEETAAAKSGGFRLASLGENTLRTEIAAIAALSVIICSEVARASNP